MSYHLLIIPFVSYSIAKIKIIKKLRKKLLSVWFGVQFVKQGIYQGGVFRFTISLPQNFPDGCPVTFFIIILKKYTRYSILQLLGGHLSK